MNSGLWADGLGPHRLALLGGSTAPETAAVALLEATPAAQRAPAAPWRDCWVQGSRQGLPSGTLAMKGSRGQYAVVVPSANVIVVRRGFDPLDARFDIDRFTHDALDVLKGRVSANKRSLREGRTRSMTVKVDYFPAAMDIQ